MLPTEQEQFFRKVSEELSAYAKFPEQRELEAWWRECRTMSMEGLDSAFKSYRNDQDRGERAPRPVDITRRMKVGVRDAQRCAASDLTGRCEYPGIFSDGTAGDGPWYCPWHRVDRMGPDASRWIERGREIPYNHAREKRAARMHEESIRAPAVVNTAHAIANRHGNRPWQTRMNWPGGLSPDEETLIPRDEEAA